MARLWKYLVESGVIYMIALIVLCILYMAWGGQ